jgi:hypothetical protein
LNEINRASVLANKPHSREKQAKLPNPLWDKGHYRTGFHRLGKIGDTGSIVLPQKGNSTAERKRKRNKVKKSAGWRFAEKTCDK